MRALRNILVALGERPAPKALARATQIALLSGASLRLFSVVDPGPQILGLTRKEQREIRDARVEHQLRALQRHVKGLAQKGVSASCRAVASYALCASIIKEAAASHAGLVVIEERRHTVLGRMFAPHHDVELIRHCPVPVLLAKTRASGIGPVLVALDPSRAHGKPATLDRALVRQARRIARVLGVPLHSAHVYGDILAATNERPFWETDGPHKRRRQNENLLRIRRRFQKANKALEIASSRTHLQMGDPTFQLPDITHRLKAQLLVMGTVPRSTLQRLVIGNTAERVLDLLPCDLLTVNSH